MGSGIPVEPKTTITEQAALRLRVAAMRRALEQMPEAIAHIQAIDASLAGRLKERSEMRAREIASTLRTFNLGDRMALESELRAAAERIQETFAFFAAAAARTVGLDQGITSVALKWADELSRLAELPRVAVVIPGVADFTVMTSSIIRLQVPGDGIWGLPVAVHEYGHFAAAHLVQRAPVDSITRSILPVEDMLHRAGVSAELPRHYRLGHELFADAFAAATAGPAYTHYYLRYCLSSMTPGNGTHPSAARRIRTQFAVLRRLADADPTGFLDSEVKTLHDVQAALPDMTGAPADGPADDALDHLERDVIRLAVEDPSLRRVAYGDHLTAWRLAEDALLAKGRFSIAQIVNAAWHARAVIERGFTNSEQAVARIDEISGRAFDLLGNAKGDTDG
jgi:hypothetical protein